MPAINLQLLQDTMSMFMFLLIELTTLFIAISYLVGVLQFYIGPEKIKSVLSAKHCKGYVIAALMGAVPAPLSLS